MSTEPRELEWLIEWLLMLLLFIHYSLCSHIQGISYSWFGVSRISSLFSGSDAELICNCDDSFFWGLLTNILSSSRATSRCSFAFIFELLFDEVQLLLLDVKLFLKLALCRPDWLIGIVDLIISAHNIRPLWIRKSDSILLDDVLTLRDLIRLIDLSQIKLRSGNNWRIITFTSSYAFDLWQAQVPFVCFAAVSDYFLFLLVSVGIQEWSRNEGVVAVSAIWTTSSGDILGSIAHKVIYSWAFNVFYNFLSLKLDHVRVCKLINFHTIRINSRIVYTHQTIPWCKEWV